ncbi:MAG: class I adenylate-forming enzyme family protein [Desulfuromonadales bacterium]
MKSAVLVHHFLEHSARRRPEKTALVHGPLRATYARVDAAANHVARWLHGRGVEKGDRVVLLFENGLDYVAAYYGVLKTGAVAVPLDSKMKRGSLVPFLAELQATAVLASARCEETLRGLEFPALGIRSLALRGPHPPWRGCGIEVAALEEIFAQGESRLPAVSLATADLASIVYTSGATGRPKGVMLTHANLVANVSAIVEYLKLTAADIQMVVLPFFYVMGKSLLNTHFAVGGTVVVNNQFAYPAAVLQQMVEEKVTGFSGVPSTYAYLLHSSLLQKYREKLVSLRYCSQAGGHMVRSIKEALLHVLPAHTRLFIMYGATEAAARLSYVEPHRLVEKIDSIGRPIPGVEIKVIGASGEEMAPGQVGELAASGVNIMQGYWKDEAATRLALTTHGYRTGDLGYRDEDGYFYVVGRKDGLLKVGGHRISPQEIEDALMATGCFVEVVVVGVPDALLGTRLVALGVPQSDHSREGLAALLTRLPRHKIPGEFRYARFLPKKASGKIDRGACAEMVRQNAEKKESFAPADAEREVLKIWEAGEPFEPTTFLCLRQFGGA